jgi:hypothetical protein
MRPSRAFKAKSAMFRVLPLLQAMSFCWIRVTSIQLVHLVVLAAGKATIEQ